MIFCKEIVYNHIKGAFLQDMLIQMEEENHITVVGLQLVPLQLSM